MALDALKPFTMTQERPIIIKYYAVLLMAAVVFAWKKINHVAGVGSGHNV